MIKELKEVAQDRKCFQLIGGVLTERTVGDVVPNLTNKKEQIEKVAEHLTREMEKGGRELIKFKEENNIQIRGEAEKDSEPSQDKSDQEQAKKSGILATN